MASYRLWQIFRGSYPPDAAIWCNKSGKYHIERIEDDEDGYSRFKIVRNEEKTPTPEEIQQMLTDAVQDALDDFAKQRNYDSIMSCCSYYGSTIDKFNKEALYCLKLRDDTWMASYAILDEVIAGTRDIPTVDELLAELPISRASWDDIEN